MPKSKKRVKKRRRGDNDEHKQFQGSMSSMRSGFQKITGTKKEKAKTQDSGFRFIAVLILIAVAILVVWGITQ